MEVSAATANNVKKSVDQKLESGKCLNNSGIVINKRPGPPATRDDTIVSGDCVKAKAAGKHHRKQRRSGCQAHRVFRALADQLVIL